MEFTAPPAFFLHHCKFLLGLILFSVFIIMASGGVCLCEASDSYRVEFSGIKDKELLSRIRDLSETLEAASKPLASVNVLKKRMSEDTDLFMKLLKSEGYFDAEITEKIDTIKTPWNAVFIFNCKTPFVLSSVNILFSDKANKDIKIPDISKTGIGLNKPYSAKAVLDGQEKLLYLIKKQGFPYPELEKREIVADHSTRKVTVEFTVKANAEAVFGSTLFTGLESIDESFIKNYLPWKKGDKFDPDLLTKGYTALMKLGLFSTVKISEAGTGDKGIFHVMVEVNERKHRSVGVGLNYHTDEGAGVKFTWENRNLSGRGEKLGFLFNLSDDVTTVEGVFKKPAFLMDKQTLRFSVEKSREDSDAYLSDSVSGSVFIDRDISDVVDVSGGLGFKYSDITQLGEVNSYSLLFMPLYLNLNKSDDLLDPSRGGRLSVKLVPYYEPSDESLFYNKLLINYRHYLKLAEKPFSVLAGSITAGMIKGARRDDIPADERFYAGGGGSVRGYPYQTVGPLSGTTPVGGKALIEMSVEARFKVTQKIGFVLFMDGGSAFTEKLFEKDEDIMWGAGAGLRYYTPIGPLRFDVALPLDKRDAVDDSFQVYISIGQAF